MYPLHDFYAVATARLNAATMRGLAPLGMCTPLSAMRCIVAACALRRHTMHDGIVRETLRSSAPHVSQTWTVSAETVVIVAMIEIPFRV